jgi:DNA-binding NtrC family response regulator
MKILIADDEEIVRTSLEGILKQGGAYEIDSALDGEEAVAKIKTELYDAVLLDLEMPKISGYDVLAKAREIHPDLPVIFITGKANVKKVAASIAKERLSGFIEKPFSPAEVLEVISLAISKAGLK